MNAKNIASTAAQVAKSGRLITCPYCMSKTISVASYCVCSWCEALIHEKNSDITNSEVFDAIKSIKLNYNDKKFTDSIASADKAFSLTKNPWFLYIKGIVQLSASNEEISLISYDKPGFMEENAVHRENGSKLYADARLSLYKSISSANSNSVDSKALDTTFLQFIASIKLQDKTAAKHYLDELSELKNQTILNYAKVLLFSLNGLFEESLKHAQLLLSNQNFMACALYYYAFDLFKLHKTKEASLAISEAIKYISTPSAFALHESINNYGKIQP